MKYFLIFSLLLASCVHKNKPQDPSETSQVDLLAEHYDGWQADLKKAADPNTGWFSGDCDGTLWVGEAVASGFTSNLSLAEWGNPGELHRRPEAKGECWPAESRTSISPDMRQGYLLGTWALQDASALERLLEYGRAANWITGKPTGDPTVVWRPTEIGLLFRMMLKLGVVFETNDRERVPLLCAPALKDFEHHVQTLGIILDGEVSGGISDICLEALRSNVRDTPTDALFQAALGVYTGDFDYAIKLLVDPDYQCPTYVRPLPVYCTIHKAYAAKLILKSYRN